MNIECQFGSAVAGEGARATREVVPFPCLSQMGEPAVTLFSGGWRSHHSYWEFIVPKAMEGNQEFAPERRRCLRQRVHGPAFASFDGVTGGMILDLSEEGLSMQMGGPFDVWGLDRGRRGQGKMNLAGAGLAARDLDR